MPGMGESHVRLLPRLKNEHPGCNRGEVSGVARVKDLPKPTIAPPEDARPKPRHVLEAEEVTRELRKVAEQIKSKGLRLVSEDDLRDLRPQSEHSRSADEMAREIRESIREEERKEIQRKILGELQTSNRLAARKSTQPRRRRRLLTVMPASARKKKKSKRSRRSRKLTTRNKEIMKILRERSNLRAEEYCMTLYEAGISTDPVWRLDKCPASYVEAYKDPYWRKRIQWEKSDLLKMSRKRSSHSS
jgi:hypothetical protein